MHMITINPHCECTLLFGSCKFLVQFLEAPSGQVHKTLLPKQGSRGSYWMTGSGQVRQTLVFLLNIRCFSWISTPVSSSLQLYYPSWLGSCAILSLLPGCRLLHLIFWSASASIAAFCSSVVRTRFKLETSSCWLSS